MGCSNDWNLYLMLQKGSITATLEDGRSVTCMYGTPVGELMTAPEDEYGRHYVGAVVNNLVVTLEFLLEVDSDIRFLTFSDPYGWRIYRSTANFLLSKVVRETYPDAKFSIEHSFGTGFYCYFQREGREDITEEELGAIEKGLRKLVERDLPISRKKMLYASAVDHFANEGRKDKASLLRFRNPGKVVVYTCEDYIDLSHGPLAGSTGALTHFNLIHHPPGFVIQFPDRSVPPRVPSLREQPLLFQIFREHKKWGRILDVSTVGRLNELVANGNASEFIRIAEALHEKKIANIADEVTAQKDRIQCLLIAGPSSSGKTTFAKRLSVQLRVNGIQPIAISVDNYFVDRDHTPRDDKGEFDFEHIEAIDLALFNEHLQLLSQGKDIDVPRFDFETGQRVYKGDKRKLEKNQIVILEGIHCLNPRLTEAIADDHKFKIYISALTQLNLDSTTRISTTDNRLVRRLVRDHQFRGHSALTTMHMWPSVRRGEKTWIFPFQREADIAFNSALDYELAVLKPLAETLLAEVKPYHPQYAEARRLQEFLKLFVPIPYDAVAPNSILREFIGRSDFRY